MDVQIASRWYINIDVKKVWIGSDLKLGGQKVSHVDVDPWLAAVSVIVFDSSSDRSGKVLRTGCR